MPLTMSRCSVATALEANEQVNAKRTQDSIRQGEIGNTLLTAMDLLKVITRDDSQCRASSIEPIEGSTTRPRRLHGWALYPLSHLAIPRLPTKEEAGERHANEEEWGDREMTGGKGGKTPSTTSVKVLLRRWIAHCSGRRWL